MPELQSFRGRLTGELVTPGDASWDEARAAWNLAVDQQSLAVVLAETTEDVVAAVDFARDHGLHVAPQGTGHGAAAMPSLENAILLKTSRMRRVRIDPVGRRARVEPGVVWQEVLDAAQPYGLTALAGSAHDVGVVGYSLGGGMGWLARKYGLSANSVVAVELVTADGRQIRADSMQNSDVFWAVRGGGGSSGVVTAIEIALYPVDHVYAGALFFPIERAAEVLHAWRAWTDAVPDDVTSCGRLLGFPPIPDLPEPLRGRSFVAIQAAHTGAPEAALELLKPLRALGPELLDTFEVIPANALTQLHMDPPGPAAGVGDGGFLTQLPIRAIEELLEVAGPDVDSPLVSVEIRHLGGALARTSPEQGAVGSIDATYVYYSVGVAPTPEAAEVAADHAHRVVTAFAPWHGERTYFNFTEREVGGGELYPAETLARLREIKAQVDPAELFSVAHAIVPAR